MAIIRSGGIVGTAATTIWLVWAMRSPYDLIAAFCGSGIFILLLVWFGCNNK